MTTPIEKTELVITIEHLHSTREALARAKANRRDTLQILGLSALAEQLEDQICKLGGIVHDGRAYPWTGGTA